MVVRFDYALVAEITIKKTKGRWRFKEGNISKAVVKTSGNFDPKVFYVKGVDCHNCSDAAKLVAQPLKGEMSGMKVRLYWPGFVPRAEVDNKLKLEFTSKETTHAGYSRNYFASEEFLGRASEHYIPFLDK